MAPELLGKILFHKRRGVETSGRIVEVEAYLGDEDPASHAYRGPTSRNQVMFGPPGFAYVYFTYGSHFCVNVVTEKEGRAGAVLIRALEPLQGMTAQKRRRRRQKLTDLASGPGKLTQALGIGRKENGLDLSGKDLFLEDDGFECNTKPRRTPRIGIRQARSKLYRFVVKDSPYLSMKGKLR